MGELQEIRGIGNTTEEKLNDLGIESVNGLANTSLETLEDENITNAEKILDRAQKEGVEIHSGEEVETEQENARYVSTGLQPIDQMLGGGLRGGFLIGLSGESKAGKTQFALHSLGAAADFEDGHAIYIETEPNRFQIDRVKDFTRRHDSYKRIHRIQAHTDDEEVDNVKLQRNAYDAIRETFDEVSLVVVDSFIANFRLSGQFEGRSDLPERNTKIADHLQALQGLSNQFGCPVLMTLQVQGNPDQFGGDFSIWGPLLMDHTITHLIHMAHSKGELKKAHLKGHPSEPDDSVLLKMPENSQLEAVE